jgi:penicillin-binding protein 1A
VQVKFTGKGLVGASTITQQVAKNFLLTNERTIERKLKEALLAFRIEQAFSKDQILELYLNEIFLGLNPMASPPRRSTISASRSTS